MSKQLRADMLLLLVTFIWGSTFVLIKNAIADIPPYTFILIRHLTAFILLSMVFIKRYRNFNKEVFVYSIIIAVFLFAGYALQTIGLIYTTASNSSFITSLAVVFVPIISFLLFKRIPTRSTLLGIPIAILGLALLTLNESLSINVGDFYTFICAISFGVSIILIERFTKKVDSVLMAMLQILFIAIISCVFSLTLENGMYSAINFSPDVIIAILITGILATGLAFVIQNTVQRYTTAAHTALIFTAEPIFGAMFAYLMHDEVFTLRHILGAGLIIAGVILAECKFNKGENNLSL
ncbi:MAG: DMT family transporter [Mahellales bacterium]